MSRTLTGPMATEVAKAQIAPVFFVEMDFASGFLRAWNGYGALDWNSHTWTGGGELMAMGQIEETRAIEATSLTLSLSGVPPAMVSVAYNDFSQGRPVTVWLGLMDTATGLVTADPVQIFAGRMDTISDQDDGQTAMISVSAESNLADLDRARTRYFTDQDQLRLFGTDRSLRYMPSIQDRPVPWGVQSQVGQPVGTNL